VALNPPITDWQGKRCWVLGASTGIGAALARTLAARGARVAISARRAEALEKLAAELPSGRALAQPLDITDAGAWAPATERVVAEWGGIDLVVFMAGDYKPMRAWDVDLPAARAIIEVNLTGILNGLVSLVPQLLKQGSGTLAIVSSVAGYRGLPKALVYGPTKAAAINLAETLYLDLQPRGIGVCVVNPGFVRTPLTAQNDFEMPYLIEPEQAAEEIVQGLMRGEFEIHFPKRFSRMLKFLRLLPYRFYFPAIRRSTKL